MAVKFITIESQTPLLAKYSNPKKSKSDYLPLAFSSDNYPLYYDTESPDIKELTICVEPLKLKDLFTDIKIDTTFAKADELCKLTVNLDNYIYRFPVLKLPYGGSNNKTFYFITSKTWKRLDTMFGVKPPEWVTPIKTPGIGMLFSSYGCGLHTEEDKYIASGEHNDDFYYYIPLSSFIQDAVFDAMTKDTSALIVMYSVHGEDTKKFIKESDKLKNEKIFN